MISLHTPYVVSYMQKRSLTRTAESICNGLILLIVHKSMKKCRKMLENKNVNFSLPALSPSFIAITAMRRKKKMSKEKMTKIEEQNVMKKKN